MVKKILFLGYNRTQTSLIDFLVEAGCNVCYTGDKIQNISGYDLVICFGYRHIVRKRIIEELNAPIINLHISYLPWNRGSHPNFWSFYDGTPSGVSLHLVDEGIDTGPIISQKMIEFLPNEDTFLKTYERLKREIEQLFIDNITMILTNKITSKPQSHSGTFHLSSELPKEFKGWDTKIDSEIKRLHVINS
jgi:methionyl-tRNA formyltransferase